MLSLHNETEFAAEIVPGMNQQQQAQHTCVIKAAFNFDEQGDLTPTDTTLNTLDQWRGEEGESSLTAACDTVPFKQGAELLLQGTAYPTQPNQRITDVEVHFQRDDWHWQKSLRVYGERLWKRNMFDVTKTDAKAMQPTPLIYENAYGGNSEAGDKAYDANPVGLGFITREKECDNAQLPFIECPPPAIEKPSQRVKPASFGPIPMEWQPRLAVNLQATADNKKPLPATLYHYAPTDQQFAKPLMGGEQLRLKGFFPEQEEVVLALPVLNVNATLVSKIERRALSLIFDTLLIDTDKREIALIFRTAIRANELAVDHDGYEITVWQD
tara:strand:+ start:41937 stop:42917 length:981 start_codon:yes stop_codon:yes gene_type:complete